MKNIDFGQKTILVLGDLMIDRYFYGQVKRISPEAPVPVFLKKSEQFVLGGAANVVANLIAAGQKVIVSSVIGNDSYGKVLQEKLKQIGSDCDGMVFSDDRPTSVKTRLLAQNHQQLIRVDEEVTDAISCENEKALLENIEQLLPRVDAIILSDYLKGVLTEKVCQGVISLAKGRSIPVFVDVKDKKADKYKNATLVKPNRNELEGITGMPVRTDGEILAAAVSLKKMCGCQYVLATLGGKGMLLVGDGLEKWIPCVEHEVFDVSGAGDTVISYLTATSANGVQMEEAAELANIAAGIKVTKLGTAPVSKEELMEELAADAKGAKQIYAIPQKCVTLDEVLRKLKNRKNKKVVFTNGCFDILHAGHVGYLNEAAKCGDILVVGLNSDASVKRLKGESRPVNNQADRASVLCALECVDYVVIFEEDTPYDLIKAIKPDVLAKGADYKKEEIAGYDIVEANGGEVALIPLLDDHSTSGIIKRINNN